jgi:hypothetical protein
LMKIGFDWSKEKGLYIEDDTHTQLNIILICTKIIKKVKLKI